MRGGVGRGGDWGVTFRRNGGRPEGALLLATLVSLLQRPLPRIPIQPIGLVVGVATNRLRRVRRVLGFYEVASRVALQTLESLPSLELRVRLIRIAAGALG